MSAARPTTTRPAPVPATAPAGAAYRLEGLRWPCGQPVTVAVDGSDPGIGPLVASIDRATGLELVYEPHAKGGQITVMWGGVGGGFDGETAPYGRDGRMVAAVIRLDPHEPAWEQRYVLAHEMGHAVGLGHSAQPGNIMDPSGFSATGWGPGDVAGLAAVGCR